jgi:hypothetical protein
MGRGEDELIAAGMNGTRRSDVYDRIDLIV